jgi:general stress protein 26
VEGDTVTDAEQLGELQRRSFAVATRAVAAGYPEPQRLSGVALAAYLCRRKYLVVATARADGRPHATMSSFVLWAGAVWLPTEAGTARIRNLTTNPHVALVVTDGEGAEHVAVLIQGPATLLDAPEAPSEISEAWRRKFDHLPEWARVWIRVEIATLFSYADDPAPWEDVSDPAKGT